MDAWRAAVLVEAESWLRTPWRHRARVKGAGVDCAQYLVGTYAGAGQIAEFDTGEYPEDWMLHQEVELFLPWIERYMRPVEAPQPADVVLWRFGRAFSHAAIVVQWPRILHAYRKEGAVVWGDGLALALAHRPKQFWTMRTPA